MYISITYWGSKYLVSYVLLWSQLLRWKQDHRSSGNSLPKEGVGMLRTRPREMGSQRPAIFWYDLLPSAYDLCRPITAVPLPVLKEYPLNLVKRKLWICVCCYCIRLTGKLRRLHGVVGTSRTHHGPGFAGRWPSHSRLHDREQESLGYLRVLRVLSLQGLCALSFTEMQNPTIPSINMVIFKKPL